MITVIYCTREEFPSHQEHIKKTSGLKDVEVIEYINHGQPLTEFYNKGLKEASNDIIVFCHDDIVFNTKKWAKRLIKHFETTDFGILGVAGTTDISESGRWWDDNTKMLGQVRHSHEGKSWDSIYCPNFSDKVLESVIVDGLFFAVKKSRLKSDFDEDFKGFHFYEIDFCVNNHLNDVKVGVMSDIRITHKSIGMTNDEWESNRKQFISKYEDKLPINLESEIFYSEKEVNIKTPPKVGVIIPTKGNLHLLTKCVDSLIEKDGYENMTIYIADTGSTPDELEQTKSLITKHGVRDIRLIEYDYYNFAQINNDVVWNHIDDDVELLLFCNNDIELINNAVTRMASVASKSGVGTVGARLYYENKTIQHSGIVAFIGQDRRIRVSHKGLGSYYGYHPRNTNVFGNTAAFMMIRKDMFNKIGGFNQGYQECFEDVELNIDCLTRNLKNVFVSDAVCYHYESQTRNNDPEKIRREGEDYTKRLIPLIITSKRCHNYFDNISAKDLELLIGQTMKRLV